MGLEIDRFQVRIALKEERAIIESLLPDYLAELQVAPPYRYLPLYWSESTRFPYLMFEASEPVGFALVRGLSAPDRHEMSEFYLVPSARRKGLGRIAAVKIFRSHPGLWELSTLPANTSGHLFWQSVTSKFADPSIAKDKISGRINFAFSVL